MRWINDFGPYILFLFALAILTYYRISKKKSNDKFGYKNTLHTTTQKKKKDSKLFLYLSKLPLTSVYIETIKIKLYSVYGLDEVSLRRKTIGILIKSAVISLILFCVVFYLIDKTFYNILLNIIIASIVFKSLVTRYVGDDTILLEQLPEAITDLKHYFSNSMIIEKAYSETLKDAPFEIRVHLNKILNIIKKPYDEGKLELRIYYDECYNKYLKILATYSFLTSEYGDVVLNEGSDSANESLFNKNMNHLIAEIRNEYRKRRNIKMQLFGQKLFVLLPIFMLPLLKKFALNFIKVKEVEEFYLSSYGYIDLLICTGACVFCYMVYNQVVEENSGYNIKIATKAWEESILNVKFIKKIVNRFSPKPETEKYRKLSLRLLQSGRQQRVEWFYLNKLLTSIAALIAITFVLATSHLVNLQRIYKDVTYGLTNAIAYENLKQIHGSLTDEELREIDKNILNTIKEEKAYYELSDEEKKLYIKNQLQSRGLKENELMGFNIDRIYEKIKALNENGIKLNEILILIFVTLFAYIMPDIKLALAAYVQKTQMIDEVMSFQTVILLLIYHSKSTPEMVLEWLVWFSNIFYAQLNEARINYNDKHKGGVLALQKLRNEVSYKPFKRLIQNLMLAEEKMPLREAFAGLEQDQKFSEDIRRDNAEIIVQTKVAIGTRLSGLSMGVTIGLYLLVPMIYAAVAMLSSVTSQVP